MLTVNERLAAMKWENLVIPESKIQLGEFSYAQPVIRQRVLKNTILYFFGSRKDITPEMELKWDTNNFSRVSDLAEVKMMQGYDFTVALHKARWQAAFSRPPVVIIYTNGEFMNEVMNFVNFFNLRGTTVCFKDYRNGYQETIRPSYNLYDDPLFRRCKIEELDFSKLDGVTLQQANKAADLLITERERKLSQIYVQQNKDLYELRQYYRILDIERLPEKLAYVDNKLFQEYVMAAQEQLPEDWAPNLAPEDMTPELCDSIQFELQLWAKAYDLDVPSIPRDNTIDGWHINQNRPQAPYAGLDLLKPALGVNLTQRFTPEQRRLYRAKVDNNSKVFLYKTELLKAYIQLEFYRHNPEVAPLRSDYTLCEICGVPHHIEAEYCSLCGKHFK